MDPIAEELGRRLKQLRLDSNLTLEALAARSGVSRAMLSKVERGEKSPTLSIMVRIARGLNVGLSALMGAAPEADEVAIIRAGDHLTFTDPESGFERQILSPAHVGNGVELLAHHIPPGASTEALPVYTTPTEKYLVVQDGQLTVYIGETPYLLNTGDSMYFEVKKPYRFANLGRKPCSYYLVIVRKR